MKFLGILFWSTFVLAFGALLYNSGVEHPAVLILYGYSVGILYSVYELGREEL